MTTTNVGRCYYKKRGVRASVRKVLRIEDNIVHYEVLHGPQKNKQQFNHCSLRSFRQWSSGEIKEKDNYQYLDGAILWRTFIVQNTKGEPILRCSDRRAKFYLRKGYATVIDEDTLRFTNDQTENKLKKLYGEDLSPFFLAVKNDRCCVCGATEVLTRHHVVPQRFKRQIPLKQRASLSNILFVCWPCHAKYEGIPFYGDVSDPLAWRDHFIESMKPQYMPDGWEIVTVKNLDEISV